MRFIRHTIYIGQPSERTSCVVGDINNDGTPEVIIAAREPKREIYWLGRARSGQWEYHLIDDTFDRVEAGGALADIDGDGKLELVAGGDWQGNIIYWWDSPDDPTKPWIRREIFRMPQNQSHDQMIADVDGDGKNELIAGLSWYRPPKKLGENWERHEFARGYVSPKSVVADFDCDGKPEIVISEGDASLNNRQYGRVVMFKSKNDPTDMWEPYILHNKLLDPHSLQTADFDGDGTPDLFVGEMGLPNGDHPHPPAQRIYLSRGNKMEEHIIDEGIGTHEAKVIVIDDKVGIVGKPYRNLRSSAPRGPEVDGVHLWLPE